MMLLVLLKIPKGCPKELCHTCGEAIAVTQLREHTENCAEMEAIDEGNVRVTLNIVSSTFMK